ncbi:MAG: hypothetical protein Q9219_000323 [cf. Caloplaca sp. 3 TL-2023]
MAPQEPDAPPVLRNILLLDKSTEPLASQIDEACDILGITISLSESTARAVQPGSSQYGPREEWTVRWLLKKLEATGSCSQSACFEPKLWQLFRELATRLPVSNLARLLRTHGFLNILLKTLKSLANLLRIEDAEVEHGLSSSTAGAIREISPEADSSSTTVEFSAEQPKASKKRKRDGTEINYGRGITVTEPDARILYANICGVLATLHMVVKDETHGYAVEHLKMALRASPGLAAEILGKSYIIATNILQGIVCTRNLRQEDSIRLYLDPWIEAWNSRPLQKGKTDGQLAFSAASFIPTLRLLSVLDDNTNSNDRFNNEIAALENLLLEHIVLPARGWFENSQGPHSARIDEATKIDPDQLLAPLQDLNFRSVNRDHPWNKKIHPVARFYRVALKHTKLATTQQRISEKPWLEFLFDHIALQASIPGNNLTSSSDFLNHANAIKDMLGMLAKIPLRLEVTTLEKVLSQFSNILESEKCRIDWDIVGLCLDINPDVFVIPHVTKTTSGQTLRKPNKHLLALFEKLNDLSRLPEPVSYTSHGNVLEAVLVPLVAGFAKARDLIGFINCWRSNLTQPQQLENDPVVQPDTDVQSSDSRSPRIRLSHIWEEEKLLQAVASHVEQRLTVGQIKTILQESSISLVSTVAKQNSRQDQSSRANLVVLDCILHGCKNEGTISQLASAIEELYTAALASHEPDNLLVQRSWRAWRCLATIRNRWTDELKLGPDHQKLEKTTVAQALKRLTQIDQIHSIQDILQPLSYAFSAFEVSDSSLHPEFASSITDVLARELIKIHSADIDPLQSASGLLDPPFGLTSHLMSFLFQSSGGQRYLKIAPKDDQINLLDKLFNHQLECFGNETDTVPAPGPWQEFLHSSILEENAALATRPNQAMHLLRYPSGSPPGANEESEAGKAALFQIAETLLTRSTTLYPDREAMNLLKLLARKILEHRSSEGFDELTVAYLTSYFEDLRIALKEFVSSANVYRMALIGASLDFYHAHVQGFPQELRQIHKSLASDRRVFTGVLSAFITTSCADDDYVFGICRGAAAADSLVPYQDVLSTSAVLDAVKADLTQLVTRGSKNTLKKGPIGFSDGPTMDKALETIKETLHLLWSKESSDLLDVYQSPGKMDSVLKQRRLNSILVNSAQNLDPDKKAGIMIRLLTQAAEGTFDRNALLLLQRLILPQPGVDLNSSADFLLALSEVVNHLCDALLQPQPFQITILSLQTIDLILQKHPRTIIQWHIDQIMAVVTTCASRLLSSSSYTPKQNGLHYLALCRLFSTVLAFHRKRLGGRYHLILLALQSLLRPLFIPFTPITTTTTASSPLSAADSRNSSSSPYTAAHASAYSRLLLQLADPPLASLRPRSHNKKERKKDQEGHPSHHHLNDLTKTAKSIAGQHLHYLVMMYCECQLQGRLEKEVREQVVVGLWAVLDVLPVEVMRVMNLALGREGRGVWRGVYGEWKRVRGGGG